MSAPTTTRRPPRRRHPRVEPERTPRTHRPRAPKVPYGRTVIIIEALLALAFLGYLLKEQGVDAPFVGADHFVVRAQFADVSGMKTANHDQVTVAGVPQGEVREVTYADGRAIVTMELEESAAGRIHSDASARIVPRSALADLTVDIDPGTPTEPALEEMALIETPVTSTTPGSDRLLAVLDADTRAQAQVLLGQLAEGLDGRGGALRDDLAQLSGTLARTTSVTAALDSRRQLLTRLVGDLDKIFARLDERSVQLAGAISAGRATLDVTGSRDAEIAESLQLLPGTLGQTTEALQAVRELAVPLNPTLEELRPFARSLPGGLAALRDFAAPGERLLGDVRLLTERGGTPVRHARQVLTELGPTANEATPALVDLFEVVDAVNQNRDGIGVLGDHFTGVFSTNDVNGTILRGLGFFEPFDPANLGFGGSASARAEAGEAATKALTEICLERNELACLVPYLVPGLPEPDAAAAGAIADSVDADADAPALSDEQEEFTETVIDNLNIWGR